ncbi:cytochrome P450 CYP82D47-like [Gastrolobium bilobum]|uniref:cytochrome P450 CYP82D47-like n=1 Tax=Gastrolobium bilobum TaxID=150636 RepID=UPI002AB12E11|nr:cytochrome P450 CYP82D47-like [Gastrolobium bilobum]
MDLQNSLSQSTVPLAFTIFGLLLFLLVLSSISRRRTAAAGKAPPEANGALPLIGHLHLLGGSQPPYVTLGNMADKYGPAFTLQLGVHRTLIVSNWEMAKECFTVNDKAFASRPKSVAFEVLGYNFSMFGFSPYGSYWRHVRKIATMELLSTKRIEMLKHVIESEVKAAIKGSHDNWLKMNKSGSENAVTDMNKWFGDIILNVMFRLTVGKRFGGVNCDGDHEENEWIRKAVRDFFDLMGSIVVSDALPYLRWLDLDGKEKEMKRTAKELDSFVQIWLEEHKRNRNSGLGEWKRKHDFMDALLSNVDEGEQFGGCDADTVIKATCQGLILAGTDTTSGTLTWALSLLLNNREVLNKAIHELDTQIGKDKMVVESDLQKLEYLPAILKETLRLYPPGPLSVPHESMEDCTIGGYHVPAGTRLLTNISKIQRDPLLYMHPLEFRPERFLTTHKDIDVRGQHFELIPFGAGRRICPGLSFALQTMHLTFATLLHGFDIVTPDGGPVDMLECVGLTNNKASPLRVILTPRLSAHAYLEI